MVAPNQLLGLVTHGAPHYAVSLAMSCRFSTRAWTNHPAGLLASPSPLSFFTSLINTDMALSICTTFE